jgi:hypothetical protein
MKFNGVGEDYTGQRETHGALSTDDKLLAFLKSL